jgi:nuclear pore complex protein Nup93
LNLQVLDTDPSICRYFSLAKDLLISNATIAKIGGAPSIIHSLHAFMEIRYKNSNSWTYPHLEIHEKTPIWLFLFVLLRSGHPKLALKFVEDQRQAFSLHEGFSSYLTEYLLSPDHR